MIVVRSSIPPGCALTDVPRHDVACHTNPAFCPMRLRRHPRFEFIQRLMPELGGIDGDGVAARMLARLH